MNKASSDPPAGHPPGGQARHKPHFSVRMQLNGQATIQPTTVQRTKSSSTVSPFQQQGQQQYQRQESHPRALAAVPLTITTTGTTVAEGQTTLPSVPPKTELHSPVELSSLSPTTTLGRSSTSRSLRPNNNDTNSSTPRPPPKSHHRLTRDHTLPAIPPPPPPHDYDHKTKEAEKGSRRTKEDEDHDSLDEEYNFYAETEKPLPPLKSTPSRQKTFLVGFMGRHPWIRQHRRRFIALVFAGIFVVLTIIIVLAVVLSSKGDGGDGDQQVPGGDHGGSGGGGGSNGGLNTGLDDKKKLADLKKYNDGKKPPSVNTIVSSGWTSQGSGEGTYYDPAERTPFGFQPGACEFEYINSPKDMIAALNHIDFKAQLYPRKSNSPACGQCLHVKGPKGSVIVQVVDVCPGCKSGDVDLAPGAFSKIANFEQGRVPITWTRCTPAQAGSLDVVG
ncbi:hypothetical protein BGW41_003485 [Actinomortierella wolfii]|nr:hypothetical protein BGW41_003485 [Actinomortierella wolfii]